MRKTLNNDNHIIAANLRRLRIESGLLQDDVATALGITHQQVQKYESGRNRLPLQTVPQLCDLLGIRHEDLLDGVRDGKRKGKGNRKGAAPLPLSPDIRHLARTLHRMPDHALRRKIIKIVDILAA